MGNKIIGKQCRCPKCNEIIICPPLAFRHDGEVKETLSHCPYCGEAVILAIDADESNHYGIARLYDGSKRELEIIKIDKESDFSTEFIRTITPAIIRKDNRFDKYEARIGFVKKGVLPNSLYIDASPFDKNFKCQVAIGRGDTVEEALIKMKQSIGEIKG